MVVMMLLLYTYKQFSKSVQRSTILLFCVLVLCTHTHTPHDTTHTHTEYIIFIWLFAYRMKIWGMPRMGVCLYNACYSRWTKSVERHSQSQISHCNGMRVKKTRKKHGIRLIFETENALSTHTHKRAHKWCWQT